jgi:hypothetical protein
MAEQRDDSRWGVVVERRSQMKQARKKRRDAQRSQQANVVKYAY